MMKTRHSGEIWMRVVTSFPGDLPESETDELEIRGSCATMRRSRRCGEIENRLVDGYVRGRSSSADQERFERHYQASPVHLQRVAVARTWLEEADQSSAAVVPIPRKGVMGRKIGQRRLFILSWQSALAVAVKCCCSRWAASGCLTQKITTPSPRIQATFLNNFYYSMDFSTPISRVRSMTVL